jgi:hypothetical protein
MELQETFPAFNFVTPCCRCGKAVNRTQHYVCFSISEMSFQGSEQLGAHCIDDHDYAALCRDCEETGMVESVADALESIQQEREGVL